MTERTSSDRKPRAGLLPFYIKLYDDRMPDKRPRIESFYRQIAEALQARGLDVLTAPVCRLRKEFEAAVRGFEQGGAEAIVTLHLAYSPSLESADPLAESRLPVIVCDTTPAYGYGPDQDPDELMYNHGIHGVQDLCNLLLRRGKPFQLEVGHWQRSDVLDRVARDVLAARLASRMRRARAGLIGEPFQGMGDFYVTPSQLRKTIGIETRLLSPGRLRRLAASVTDEELEPEREQDRERFEFRQVKPETYERSLRISLAVERWVAEERLDAFSFNFLSVSRARGMDTVPFLAASKLLARGIGYGGEGDLLTASLVAALASVYPETSFTEMFCPDWEHGTIYLSHMGELNWRLAEGKPLLLEMDYRWSDTGNPVYLSGRFKPGSFVLVNLAPMREGYRLIVTPAEMLPVAGQDRMERSIRGWFRPPRPMPEFLHAYSHLGGTHHLALSYGAAAQTVEAFGRMMGWDTLVLQ
jgi:L-arabinose isomerase